MITGNHYQLRKTFTKIEFIFLYDGKMEFMLVKNIALMLCNQISIDL